jgi:ApbE superfamily uncharacterized protein (UPF0280 family)
MNYVAYQVNIGPFATVAGAVSEFIARDIIDNFDIEEIIIENGGDIFLKTNLDINLSVFAGTSPLSEKIFLNLPSSKNGLGVCTSAGTIGHSYSAGKADAVCVVSEDTLFADALATKIGNEIVETSDIEPTIEKYKNNKYINSLLIIKDDVFGYSGEYEINFGEV